MPVAYDDRALRGVGGWLAFFILTLAVFGPLRAIIQTASTLYGDPSVAAFYGPRWVPLQVIEWGLVAVSVGVSLFLARRMYAVHVWRSVRLTILGLWLLSPVVQLLDAVAVALLADVDIYAVGRAVGGETFRGFVYAAIWTAYLLRSRRVADTYARYPDNDELVEVFD